MRDDGPHIQPECAPQAFFRIHKRTALLQPAQPGVIYRGSLRVQLLRCANRLDHRFDLPLQIVALVHHECDIGRRISFRLERKNFVEDAEHLIRIDGTKSEIVVRVSPIVEMKPSNHLVMEKPGDDLLDVLRLIVMPGVHEHERLRTGGFGQKKGHAPIGDVGVIKRWFEGLIFD